MKHLFRHVYLPQLVLLWSYSARYMYLKTSFCFDLWWFQCFVSLLKVADAFTYKFCQCLTWMFHFCSEALPFFLLLIDLSKASALARFALSSKSQVSWVCYISWPLCQKEMLGPHKTPRIRFWKLLGGPRNNFSTYRPLLGCENQVFISSWALFICLDWSFKILKSNIFVLYYYPLLI